VWLLASQGLCSVHSVVFSDLLINSTDHSLKALCVLFHTHCIYLHYVLHGPIHRTVWLCFVRSRPQRGTGEGELWLPLTLIKMCQSLDQGKTLITSIISGFCHSANELFALLLCYEAQISSYWCCSTTVCPNWKGQAVQAWSSDLGCTYQQTGLTDMYNIRHIDIIMSYFHRPDSCHKLAEQTVMFGLML
jgi:hypothetical protein